MEAGTVDGLGGLGAEKASDNTTDGEHDNCVYVYVLVRRQASAAEGRTHQLLARFCTPPVRRRQYINLTVSLPSRFAL